MKKYILCLIVIHSAYCIGYGQKSGVLKQKGKLHSLNQKVYIDLLDTGRTTHLKFDKNKPTVKYNGTCFVTITNVNTLIYDVEIKGEQFSTTSEAPAFFNAFFKLPVISESSINTTPSKQAAQSFRTNPPQALASVARTRSDAWDNLNTLAETFQQRLKRLEDSKVFYEALSNTAYSEGKKGSDIIAEATSLANTYTSVTNKAAILGYYRTLFNSFQSAYTEFSNAYNSLTDPDETVTKLKQSIDKVKSETESFNYQELFTRLVSLYDKATNPNTFMVSSVGVPAKADLIQYSITVRPKNGNTNINLTPDPITIDVAGGWKWDFSSGVFCLLGPRSYSYTIDSIPNDTFNIKIRETKNKYPTIPALGALIHMSWRAPSGISPGICVGASLDTTDIKYTTLLFGGSLIVGQKERLAISGGFNLSPRQTIRSQYEIDTPILKSTVDADNLTGNSHIWGYFIGVTYNFTNKKKVQ
jgi:hypothetical protein